MGYIIGIDIGGTKCAVILGNYSEKNEIAILDKCKFPTDAEKGVLYTLEKIQDNINSILVKNQMDIKQIDSIGISCGGPLDSKSGIIMSPPNLIGWDEIHIVELFQDKFKVKTKLQNDANACALAEWKFGAGKGYSNVVFLTFGTGMGAGLILDDKLYIGANGMAGEVGHVRLDENGPVGYGKSGSFEGFCSGGGIAQLARIKVLERLQRGEKVAFCHGIEKLDSLSAKLVGEAADNGDELAIEIYNTCGNYLGRGLSIIIDIVNPDIIVIGSIFSRRKELLLPSAMRIINSECLSYCRDACKIVAADLGEEIGDFAAIAVAVYD